MNRQTDFEENLPLTEVSYFILLSLAYGPRHGYAIMKDVEAISQNRVSLSTGTLYGALKRMLEQGWILRLEEETEPTGRMKKAYRLTELGSRLLSLEINRLETLVTAARFHPLRETQ